MNTMSSTLQASSSSSSTPNFQPIFKKALKVYKKKTGEDLINHPLAAEIDGCGSPDAILTVLQAKVNDLDQSNDQRLTRWLTPAVNVLNVLSATLGQGVGLVSSSKFLVIACALTLFFQVFPPINNILSGISILLVVSFIVQSFCRAVTTHLRRQRRILPQVAKRLSSYSTGLKASSPVSRPI
jgi:hypothetical protein